MGPIRTHISASPFGIEWLGALGDNDDLGTCEEIMYVGNAINYFSVHVRKLYEISTLV